METSHQQERPVLRRAFALALAAAFVAAGGLPAQGHDGKRGGHEAMRAGGGMHGGHGSMLAKVPVAILHQGELLELTDDQVERLKSLKDSVKAVREGHRKDRGSMHGGMKDAFGEDGIDVQAYESALRSRADRRVAARVEVARIAQRALQVLEADQREKFLYGVHLMKRMHRGHHGGHGDRMERGKMMKDGGMSEKGMMEKHDGKKTEEKEKKEGGGR